MLLTALIQQNVEQCIMPIIMPYVMSNAEIGHSKMFKLCWMKTETSSIPFNKLLQHWLFNWHMVQQSAQFVEQQMSHWNYVEPWVFFKFYARSSEHNNTLKQPITFLSNKRKSGTQWYISFCLSQNIWCCCRILFLNRLNKILSTKTSTLKVHGYAT